MSRRLISTILFAIPFLFCPHPALAQSPAFSSCPCTLQGSVVDSVSGQPVPHALVRLAAPSPRSVLTDSEGKFQFEALPAGSVTLEAEKPGFLSRDPTGRWPLPSVSVQLSPDTSPATLKLTPEGIISGQICDDNGEPLEGFTIRVLVRAQDKRLYPDEGHRGTTDDEGRFRISGLHHGSYYLAVRQPQGAAQSSSRQSAAPMGYPAVFFPSGTDLFSATPLKVLPGRTIQANFSIKRVPFIRLSGTVSGYTPQEQVSLLLKDFSGVPETSEIVFDKVSGSFHTKWIPSGVYTLTAQSSGEFLVDGPVDLSTASQRSTRVVVGLGPGRLPTVKYAGLSVTALSSLSNLHLVLQQGANIPASVRIPASSDSAEQQAPVIQLFLSPKDTMSQNAIPFAPAENPENPQVSAISKGSFLGVIPGAYQLAFAVGSNSNSYYIESASWGSVDLLRDDLVLDDSASVSPVDIVFRDDAANLNGTVVSDGHPVPSMVVLLSDKRTRTRFLSTSPDGRFTSPALAPGVYRVFAVDSFANFDYEDPASLTKISSKIQEITLASKQSATINLELATVEE